MDDLDLDRALEKAFAVTPSPEFVARVRTKISAAPPPSAFPGWLKPAAAIGCVVALAIAAGLTRQSETPSEARAGLKPGTTDVSLAPTIVVPTLRSANPIVVPTFRSAGPGPVAAPARASVLVAEPSLPEVIVAAEDVEAFRQFVTAARERRFSASFDKTPDSTPWVITDLSVSPNTIEPLESAPAHNN